MDKKALVIFHNEDNDGFLSCAICERHIEQNLKDVETITRLGVTYSDLDRMIVEYGGEECVINYFDKYDYIFMLDISFNNILMMSMIAKKLIVKMVWIDHHKAIIDNSVREGFDNLNGMRDTNYSTMNLCYQYFFPFEEIPKMICMLSYYDSWTFRRHGYREDEVSALNLSVTDYVVNDDYDRTINVKDIYESWNAAKFLIMACGESKKFYLNEFLHDGYKIYNHEKLYNAKLVKDYAELDWTLNGESCAMLIMQGSTHSNLFESLDGKVKHGIVFKKKFDKWMVSCYNIGNQEMHIGKYLSEIYGGGGHQGAGGCTISNETFLKLLSKKSM